MASSAPAVGGVDRLNSADSLQSWNQWEHLLVLVTELESVCSTGSFDYSAVQVIVDELRRLLPELPASPSLASNVQSLGSAVQITTGLGQIELWMALRPLVMDSSVTSRIQALCARADIIADEGEQLVCRDADGYRFATLDPSRNRPFLVEHNDGGAGGSGCPCRRRAYCM